MNAGASTVVLVVVYSGWVVCALCVAVALTGLFRGLAKSPVGAWSIVLWLLAASAALIPAMYVLSPVAGVVGAVVVPLAFMALKRLFLWNARSAAREDRKNPED